MTYGIRIRRNDGSVKMDSTTRMGRVLGSAVTTAGINSSVTHAGFAQGTPYWYVAATGGGTVSSTYAPKISISGSTLSWTYEGTWSGAKPSVTIIYGVF